MQIFTRESGLLQEWVKVPTVLLLSRLRQVGLGWGQNFFCGPGFLNRSGDNVVQEDRTFVGCGWKQVVSIM